MKFDWDEAKNKVNFKKHGVWFEEAQTVSSERKRYDPVLWFVNRNLGGNEITGNIPYSLQELTNLTDL